MLDSCIYNFLTNACKIDKIKYLVKYNFEFDNSAQDKGDGSLLDRCIVHC